MPDKFSKDVRSKIMRSIKSAETSPELKLRRALWGKGFSYQPSISGSPDFVHRKKKVAVYVHGCFWHACPLHYREPQTRKDYWVPKICRNAGRDKENVQLLRNKGFKVFQFWEHEIENNVERCAERLGAA